MASALPAGLSLGVGTPRVRQTDRPFSVGTPCLRQAERTVGTAPYRIGVLVVLPVVLPAAGEADLELTPPIERRVPTARTRVRSAARFSHHRSQVQRLDVLLEPSGAAREFSRGRPLLPVGMLVHPSPLRSAHAKYRVQRRKALPPHVPGQLTDLVCRRAASGQAAEHGRALRRVARCPPRDCLVQRTRTHWAMMSTWWMLPPYRPPGKRIPAGEAGRRADRGPPGETGPWRVSPAGVRVVRRWRLPE